jgi:penicillin-binding protein 1C
MILKFEGKSSLLSRMLKQNYMQVYPVNFSIRIKKLKRFRNKFGILTIIFIVLFLLFWQSLPEPLFDEPTSTVLEDRNGELLSAMIANDEQWRFPYNPDIPEKFKIAIINFEDKRFYNHIGIDPFAIVRATFQNIKYGRIVSGASTITMQVIRLSRKGKERTFPEKLIEAILAIRLECSYSKDEILSLYFANAPFGGNIVGLDAASWRYFGRRADQLSWAEVTTLAVLPNNPSLVHPGKNQKALTLKRNHLLKTLQRRGYIDSLSCKLAISEPLPQKPLPLPNLAFHLLNRVNLEDSNPAQTINSAGQGYTKLRTTLDIHLQKRVNEILEQHYYKLSGNGIYNACALVIENETGDVLAYVGNIGNTQNPEHSGAVDIITSPRSTGSILKPFLYSAMLQDGKILPQMLVADIPTQFGGFTPKNFNEQYEGAVPMDKALARSLNVPAVRMLSNYGVVHFYELLKKLGLTTLTFPAEHYGLSLILGGAEGKLWEIAGAFASMARTLNHFNESEGQYFKNDFRPLNFHLKQSNNQQTKEQVDSRPIFSASVIWHTFEALSLVVRPESEGLWEYFGSSRKIAWKTGTSFGFRDGWAIGCSPEFTIGVWVGNADGEGRPGLIGGSTSAPIMFDIFNAINNTNTWFEPPLKEMSLIEMCTQSGHRAKDICESRKLEWITKFALKTNSCPYHKLVHLDPTATWQVHGNCISPSEMLHKSWFVLPPAMEWFYKSKQGNYRTLPPYRSDCLLSILGNKNERSMELIYPRQQAKIYVPIELDGSLGSAVFEVAHRVPNKIIHWHLDGNYLGQTQHFHQMAIHPDPGFHKLILVDEDGEYLEQNFEIIGKELW